MNNYTVTIVENKVEKYGSKTFNVDLNQNDVSIKRCTNCVGEHSAMYWSKYLTEIMKKLQLIEKELTTDTNDRDFLNSWKKKLIEG